MLHVMCVSLRESQIQHYIVCFHFNGSPEIYIKINLLSISPLLGNEYIDKHDFPDDV
jgi:hypothetical protein